MAERNTDFFKVMVGQIAQNAWINVVLGKALRVLPQAKLLEPLRNLLHWLHRHLVSGWPNFRPTAKKRYPNVSGIARLACGKSPASAFDYLPKWCVSADVRHQEAHGILTTTVRAISEQAALRNETNMTGTGD
jgi:hypothetical protein